LCANPGHRIIYFGPSVLDAECMAFLLRSRGIAAAFVSGGTRDVTRRRLITEFREGALQVLCNCEVLTTGFDAPRVTHVVMARPTVSQVLYEQMVGRGLRGPGFGGTASCVIVDLEDNYRSDRPVLGYQAFRELWTRGRRLRAGARGEIPADPPASKRE
ncbi:MAG: DEAD/DEAH box helicase, partial [Betaproteobacteria bacterium]